MKAARGIAGSAAPEADGAFLCADEFEARFFVGMNNTGGPVDVWAVTSIDERQLVESGNGFCYFPAKIPPSQVALIERPGEDAAPGPRRARRGTGQPFGALFLLFLRGCSMIASGPGNTRLV